VKPTKYEYSATVHRVVDGDTVYFKLESSYGISVDFGFGILDFLELKKEAIVEFRLAGIDTPETVGATRDAGLAAKVALERLLGAGKIRLVSHKADKYGRWLADVYVTRAVDGVEIDVCQELIKGGYAKPYDGGTKRP
jgi:endonuclease YncB( thermonuclease family)